MCINNLYIYITPSCQARREFFTRSASKEYIPPLLPEVLYGWGAGRMGCILLALLVGTHNDYGMLSWANITELLPSFALDDGGVLVLLCLLYQAIMIGLELLRLLLRLLYTLHQLAI